MAINKRELELSQSLMDLQSRYNELVKENNSLRSSCSQYQGVIKESLDRVDKLTETVSILKSLAKNRTTAMSKEYAAKIK